MSTVSRFHGVGSSIVAVGRSHSGSGSRSGPDDRKKKKRVSGAVNRGLRFTFPATPVPVGRL